MLIVFGFCFAMWLLSHPALSGSSANSRPTTPALVKSATSCHTLLFRVLLQIKLLDAYMDNRGTGCHTLLFRVLLQICWSVGCFVGWHSCCHALLFRVLLQIRRLETRSEQCSSVVTPCSFGFFCKYKLRNAWYVSGGVVTPCSFGFFCKSQVGDSNILTGIT